MPPILEVQSRIAGRNATIAVYPDRIEWSRPRSISPGKVTAAVLTGGISLVGGIHSNRGSGSATIPMRQVAAVNLIRKGIGMAGWIVSISTASGIVEAVCSKSDAEALRDAIMRGISGAYTTAPPPPVVASHAAPVAPVVIHTAPAHAAPAAPAASIADQLVQLKSLFDAGVLSPDEYEAKRAILVAQL